MGDPENNHPEPTDAPAPAEELEQGEPTPGEDAAPPEDAAQPAEEEAAAAEEEAPAAEEEAPAAEAQAPPPVEGAVAAGNVVPARVTRVTQHHAYLALPEDHEGVCSVDEIRRADSREEVAEDEEFLVYVLHPEGAGDLLRVSRALARGVRSPEDLPVCFKERIPVEGKVTARRKGGYDVFIAGQRAFLPLSQADTHQLKDPESLVGQLARFRIIEMDPRRKNLVVSRRKVLETDARRRATDLRGSIEQGQEMDGVVRRLADFGAFVDVGGLEGLVHVTELSWQRVEHPSDMLSPGDAVRVKVLRYTPEGRKLSLSIRALQPNPWDGLGTDFVEDGIYPGKVVRIEQFGAFVELADGLDGLVHNTELSWDDSRRGADEVLTVGEEIQVRLLTFDGKRRRISLSIKAVQEDPWKGVAERFTIGAKIKGTVERVAKFGVFVSLGEGVTALLPAGHTGIPRERSLLRAFPPGATVEAEVIELDVRRHRLTLSKTGSDDSGAREMAQYRKQKKAEKTNFGTFGDLLAGIKTDDED